MFMKPEITYGTFVLIEAPDGDWLVPEADYNPDRPLECTDSNARYVLDTEELTAWFARLSAPGYLDCTAWFGPYTSRSEAAEELEELYGSDDDVEES